MIWELREVGDIECTLDDSGIYVVINRAARVYQTIGKPVRVRADIMTDDGKPLMSFSGQADNVRKAVIQWVEQRYSRYAHIISAEHASYIGWELHRAETDPNYVQD